jgi:hypothetical protein
VVLQISWNSLIQGNSTGVVHALLMARMERASEITQA